MTGKLMPGRSFFNSSDSLGRSCSRCIASCIYMYVSTCLLFVLTFAPSSWFQEQIPREMLPSESSWLRGQPNLRTSKQAIRLGVFSHVAAPSSRWCQVESCQQTTAGFSFPLRPCLEIQAFLSTFLVFFPTLFCFDVHGKINLKSSLRTLAPLP